MQIQIEDLKRMAESVAWECLGLRGNLPLGITSIGYNPGARLQVVFEGEVGGHLIQIELSQQHDDTILGQPLKPFDCHGLRLIFHRTMWAYRKEYL